MQKFIEHLNEAQKTILACDHLTYITYPLIKDKKILIKIITELKKALAHLINATLQYEYIFKKIKLYKDTKENLRTYFEKSSKRFQMTSEEIKNIKDIFEIEKIHKQSPMEIKKDNKVIIFRENYEKITLDLEKTKKFLEISKKILSKTKNNLPL